MDEQFERLFGISDSMTISDLRKHLLTGSILFRGSRQKAPGDETDRKLAIVVGVVALPEDSDIKDHTQFPVVGTIHGDKLVISVELNEGIDRNEEFTGAGLSGIVTSPIWRT